MMKKTIASLLIMGAIFSTVGIKANAETDTFGWKQNSDNSWSYSDSLGIYSNKWHSEYGQWYYFDQNGKMATGLVTAADGKKYYLDESGEMRTGWICMDGPWYFFDRTTGAFVG